MVAMATKTPADPAATNGKTSAVSRVEHAPSSWGLGDGAAIPWEYAPAPESRDIVTIKDRYGLFIGGSDVAASDGRTFTTVNPATEEPLAEVARATAADMRSGGPRRAARPDGLGHADGQGAGKYLFRIARILQERTREFAVLESMDSGKPIKESRDVDVPLAAAHFWYYAGWADKLEYAFPGRVAKPLGVAAQIIPWNFPLLMLAWKIAPALAAGNTVVLKPASTTPLSALLFAEVCRQADLPPGVVNIVPGPGAIGMALVTHPGVDKVAFTGSTEIGPDLPLSQGGPRRAPRLRRVVGHAARQGAGQVPVPDRADPPGAQPRVRRPRIDGLGQADQGEPRRRRAARGGPLLVLRRLGGQARVRVPGPRRAAARRRRPDHPVELPAADAGLEDRAGPRRRQHGRPQARLDDAAVARSSSPTSAARPTCRRASSTSSPGPGEIGMALVTHPGVDKVAFTGSTEIGKRIAKGVAGTDKALTLELGGKAANIVFDDAPLDQAVEGIVNGIYFNQGEVCCAGSRLLVQESIVEPLIEKLKDRLSTIRVGDPLDKNTDVGAINSKAQLEKITELVGVRRGRGRRDVPARLRPARARLLLPPDAVHQRRPEPPHRARGDLRAGPVGADVPDAGRGGREGQQHALRPVGRDLDRQGLADPRDGPADEGRRRLGQHVQPVRPDLAVRRLQGVGLRARGRHARPPRLRPARGPLSVAARVTVAAPRRAGRGSTSARPTSCTSAARSRAPRSGRSYVVAAADGDAARQRLPGVAQGPPRRGPRRPQGVPAAGPPGPR